MHIRKEARRKSSRRTCIGLAFVAFLSISILSAIRVQAQPDETSRSWNQPVKPFRIIGNIYYVGATEVSSFLIVTPKGHILLDSGFAETVPQIKQNITQLGFRVEDVKVLLNSHAHYDHAGGLASLKQVTGASLMASEADAALLAAGGKGDFAFGDRFAYEPVTADRILRDGDKVELGDVTMVAHLTPGHTKGCTTWTTTVKEGARHYKVVFVGSASVPGYNLVDNKNYPSIAYDYMETFSLLNDLRCDVFLAPHGSSFKLLQKSKLLAAGKRPNPFVDGRGYRRYVAETERAFHDELRRQGRAAACSQSDGERESLIRRAEENKFMVRRIEFLGNTYTRDNVLRRRFRNVNEGDVFKRENLVQSLQSVSRLRSEIYPVQMKDVGIHLEEADKIIDMVICLTPKRQ